MRQIIVSLIAFLVCTTGALAQAQTDVVAQPFVAGNPGVFTTTAINLNFQNFFSGLADDGVTSLRPNSRQTFHRFGQTVVPAAQTDKKLYVEMVGLQNSTNLRTGSTGFYFDGSAVPFNSFQFQFAPVSSFTGLASGDYNASPFFAITDQNGARTRILPVTAGLIATNTDIINYQRAQDGNFTDVRFDRFGYRTPTVDDGFYTVIFDRQNLNVQGNVTRFGLVFAKQGIVLLPAPSINGSDTVAINLNAQQGFPF